MSELMTQKDELYKKAESELGVKLDRRLKLTELEDQFSKMEREKKNPAPKPKLRRPKTIRNIFTGHEFSYEDVFKGLPDLEVIEWEEDDGDD
jgi:hypothetical protein